MRADQSDTADQPDTGGQSEIEGQPLSSRSAGRPGAAGGLPPAAGPVHAAGTAPAVDGPPGRTGPPGPAAPGGAPALPAPAPPRPERAGGLLVVPLATALIGDDGRILHWSDGAESLLGYPPAEAVGRFSLDLLVPEDLRKRGMELFTRILSGSSWSGAFPMRHRDGHQVELEFRTHPVTGPGLRPMVLAVATDVRSLRRVEEDLAVLDAFFAQAPIGLMVYDTDLRFVRVNEALARMNGVSQEGHLGRRLSEVLPGINGLEIEAVMQEVLDTGRPVVDARSHGRTPGDPDRDHAWSASYFRLQDPAGRILGVCSSLIDVTERFEADARAARARDRLAMLVEATGSVGTTLDLRETARELAAAMVPQLADVGTVFVLEHRVSGAEAEPGWESEPVRRIAAAAADPALPLQDLELDEVCPVPPGSPYAQALATGRTVEVPWPTRDPLTEIRTARLRRYVDRTSWSVRATPLVARGRVLGLVVYARHGEREPFEDEDTTLADQLAARAAVSIDNAWLYTREHSTAEARQRALQEANAARERLLLINEAGTRIGTTLDMGRTARELMDVAVPRLADAAAVAVRESVVHGAPPAAPDPDWQVRLRTLAVGPEQDRPMTAEGIDAAGTAKGWGADTYHARCLASGRPVLVPEVGPADLERIASVPSRVEVFRREGLHSYMAVPMRARGLVLGGAEFVRLRDTPEPFTAEDLALAVEITARAAISIDNARLYTSQRESARQRQQALEEAQTAQARLALINEAGSRIGTTLDLRRTAEELVELAVPRFADLVTVDLLDPVLRGEEPSTVPEDGPVLLRAVAVGRARGPGASPVTDTVGETSEFGSSKLYARSLRTGRSVLVADVTEDDVRSIVATPDRVAPALEAGVRSYLMVPLLARGAVLGGAEFVRLRGSEPFGPEDVALAEELVSRAAVCVDNARLYRRERATALTLQRSLLPQEVHPTLGLEIAHRYLPSSLVSEVGGDWFDVVPLSCGRVALVVGDVMGHGIRAAATMGQIRTVARTLATLDMPPEQLLTRLDETTSGMGEGQFATCVCAVYDPVERSCTVASAGHLPPVVSCPDGSSRPVDVPSGVPLGVGGAVFESVDLTLPEGAVLVLYTDGLVERRGEDIDQGIGLLCRTVAERRGTLEETCDAVVETLVRTGTEDDVAVIMARATPVPADRVATLPLDRDRTTASEARRFTRQVLQDWRLNALSDFAQLLVSELVTNALLHAGAPKQLRLIRDRVLTVEVADIGHQPPRLRRASAEDEGGRGMRLVNELAHRWGSRTTPLGKVVWAELELPPGHG
ncbi:SpoIIE family protein phosphatase [Streptacidiphilus sp. ASG 303]|uniref:SpoIIE family protein phosphatase n=1 Tax=Streptacidiphilus sp. ASG 303 TaxID=2896847 RepID=UPI001E439962|nr:SpoIIE family protein phosphatase [Streptacidiphilus sp. ASG 303]MCD0482345.1 SpoIIE family protein phosphatase [Streptacidiphilus sp. ASG 303]